MAYINVFILVHLSVIDIASVGLTLDRLTLSKGTGVPQNYAVTYVNKVD